MGVLATPCCMELVGVVGGADGGGCEHGVVGVKGAEAVAVVMLKS